MAANDTKQNEKVDLEADDTFTIRYQGKKLKFQLHAADRWVELVSVRGPGKSAAEEIVGTMSKVSLLRMMTSPKVAFERSLLEKLSRADTVVFSDVSADTEGLKVTLPSLSKLSKDMTKRGGTKPLVVLRVPEGGRADSRVDFDKAIRTFRARKHGLDTHVISVRGLRKKSGL
jgi:hypothetical protein